MGEWYRVPARAEPAAEFDVDSAEIELSFRQDRPGRPSDGSASAAQAIDLTALTLRGATGAAVAHCEAGVDVSLGRWRAVIGVAADRDRRSDAFLDRALDHDDPAPTVQEGLDPVTHVDRRRRLGCLAVHVDVTPSARGSRLGAGLRESYGVEPLVDADGLDGVQSAASGPSSSPMTS